MPTDEELNEMAYKIAGMSYAQVANPVNRMEIMRLTLAAISADALSDIRDAAINMDAHLSGMKGAVIDGWNNLDVELTKIGDWFKHSRTWDGM